MDPIIAIEGVGKIYGGIAAVSNINFSVQRGEICVLVGPSGCGKTTTLKMINRVIEPTTGRILVRGTDNRKLDPVSLRRGIGYVIQQVGLFPHMTVEDNVTVVLRLTGVSRAQRRERAAELLNLVGLSPGEFLDRHPAVLSGGQQQRVGVARALAADPDIILMDEPFGAVDPLVRKQLQRELRRIQESLHRTIVFVTHDLSEALFLGDRIIVMRTGSVVQVGSPRDLLFAPADAFVTEFFADSRDIGQLRFRTLGELARTDSPRGRRAHVIQLPATLSLLDAIVHLRDLRSDTVSGLDDAIGVTGPDGAIIGSVGYAALLRGVGDAVGPGGPGHELPRGSS